MSARRTWFSTIVHTIDAAVIIQWQYDSFQRDDPRDQHRDPRERYCRKRKTKLMADSFTESLHVYIFLFRFVSFFLLLIDPVTSFFFIAWHNTLSTCGSMSRRGREILPFPSRETGTRLTNIGANSRWNVSDTRFLDSSRLASLSRCSVLFCFSMLAWSIALGLSCRLRRKGWWSVRGKGISSWLGRCRLEDDRRVTFSNERCVRSIEDIESCVKMRQTCEKRTDRAPND